MTTIVNGKPVGAKSAAAASAKHHALAGEVGNEVGEHGNLGTNAAGAKIRSHEDLPAEARPAVERLASKGFSFSAAVAIVDEMGADAVLKKADQGDARKAAKFVEAHGYTKEAAKMLVDRVGSAIFNAVEDISEHDPAEQIISLWDFTA